MLTAQGVMEVLVGLIGLLVVGAAVVAQFASLKTTVHALAVDVASLTKSVTRLDRHVAKLSVSADASGPHRHPHPSGAGTSDPPED